MQFLRITDNQFTRITINHDQMGGVPCIRGLRIPVVTVVEMLADGMTTEEILTAFPDLEYDDIRETLKYVAFAVQGQKDLDETSLAQELPLAT